MHRDMMPHFELYQPDSVQGALDLAHAIGPGAWFLAGGNDSLDWFKDRNKRPAAVIELAGIKELYGIRETADAYATVDYSGTDMLDPDTDGDGILDGARRHGPRRAEQPVRDRPAR